MKGFALTFAVVVSALGAVADEHDNLVASRAACGTAVVPGQWHAGWKETYDAAVAEGLPIVGIFSNGHGCSHCSKLVGNLTASTFTSWMKDSGIVFFFTYNGDKASKSKVGGRTETDGDFFSSAMEWCRQGNASRTTVPLCRFYWKKDGKVLVDAFCTGDKFDDYIGKYTGSKTTNNPGPPKFVDDAAGDYGTYNPGGRRCVYYITNAVNGVFRNYSPAPVIKFSGGSFVTTNTTHACLQALPTTSFVDVPMVRLATDAFSQKLVVSYRGTKVQTNEIEWAEGQQALTNRLDNFAATYFSAGADVTLKLLDVDGAAFSETKIACLAADLENSPSNPHFDGEKTADELPFGEWTTDLAVATGKVAKATGDAHTLVLVGGSTWCPDCVKTDRWLLEQPKFKQWTVDNQIACVTVDVPKMGTTTPSLFTYEPTIVSDRYVQACEDGEASRVQSGAGYLSRHRVSGEAAARVAARNYGLLYNSTEEGGLCRPENTDDKNAQTGMFKTGVPCLVLLRKDGTICGRMFQFNNVSPSEFKDVYITRLNEMLALDADADEEDNENWRTTAASVPMRGTVSGKTISYCDVNDWYRIGEDAKGSLESYSLTGDSKAYVDFSLVQRKGGKDNVLASAGGRLCDGLRFSATVEDTNCFLRVAVPLDDRGVSYGAFDFTNESTTVGYTLASDYVLIPVESEKSNTITDGNRQVSMSLEQDTTYRIVGLDDTSIGGIFAKGASDGLYVAVTSGVEAVKLISDTVTYQIWNTGKVGFERATATIGEAVKSYTVSLVRDGGSSGSAKVRINLDAEASTKLPNVYAWADEGRVFTWGEGETEVQTTEITLIDNEFSDGDQLLVFRLTKLESDAGIGIGELKVVLKDNDDPNPGRISIGTTLPRMAKQGVVIAKAGSEVELDVVRLGGADGVAGGKLTASSGAFGDLPSTNFTWEAREGGVENAKHVVYAVPSSGKSAAIRLSGVGGTKTDGKANALKVTIVDAAAPGFDKGELAVAAMCNVAIEPKEVALADVTDAKKAKVSKYSGSLPSGLKLTYDSDAGKVVLSGTPKKAGPFSAVYRVSEGSVAGLTLAVTVQVAVPSEGSEAMGVSANPNLEKTRTIKGVMVVDGEKRKLCGVLDLTIPKSGRLSAKYRAVGGTYSYQCDGWSDVAEDGSFNAVLVAKKLPELTFAVSVKADPLATVEVTADGCSCLVPNFFGHPVSGMASLGDYYTVSIRRDTTPALACGDGYVTLKMTSSSAKKKGVVTYAGLLPNGKGFSGSAALSPCADTSWNESESIWTEAYLPLVSVCSTDALTGVVEMGLPNGSRRSVFSPADVRLDWSHVGEKKQEAFGYETQFEAFGSRYDSAECLTNCCAETFGSLGLSFFVMPNGLVSERLGALRPWSTNDAVIVIGQNKATPTISVKTKTSPVKITKYDRTNGILSGTVQLEFENGSCKANWRGVILPGWGSSDCTECSLDAETKKRPMISGACWFDDQRTYLDAKDTPRSVKVRVGVPISIGMYEGQ